MPLEKCRRGLPLRTLLGFGPHDVEHGFSKFRDIGFTSEMAEALQAARVYTTIVEDYLRRATVKPDFTMIIDQRNLVHYSILFLPSASEIPSLSHPEHGIIYESCRLAALVYGVGVVFPLPAGSTPLSDLARLIKAVLQIPSTQSVWSSPDACTALIWVLVLGGIAAENISERLWFVTALGHTARQNRIACWDDLRSALGAMLWSDAACEQPGKMLWVDVERSFRFFTNGHGQR